MLTYILLFASGAIACGTVIFFFHQAIIKNQSAAWMEKLQLHNNLQTQLTNEKQQLELIKDEWMKRATKAESEVIFLKDKLEQQKEELGHIGESFKFEFRNLAQNILDEKAQKFTEVNEEKMKAILDPLKNDLGIFKQKVEETYDKESKERFSLAKEIERLVVMTQQVSNEANNLTTALKGNNKMQGNWGEMILESLLENSGLTKGREYFVQEFIRDNAGNIVKDENGAGLQPDVTICYPDQRKIIIDSKVSLVAWDQFIACDNVEEQKLCLHQHIKSIRAHIDGLCKKNYPKYALALNYVLLFIPIEPAFLEAVKTDILLWKYAYDKKVLLVSPTNLFAVLKIIADLWKVEQQNKNALDIADKAGSLYDKFVLFLDNFETIGKKINEANHTYETAMKQLSTGRGNVVGKIEELKKMGANASKQLPDSVFSSF
ncbi:MAG: DNA recombination protein RmuC [Ginsengibacter sp.]